jgi:hypothetical protein
MSAGIIFASISPAEVSARKEDRDRFNEAIIDKYEEIWMMADGDEGRLHRLIVLCKEIAFLKVAVAELTFLLENCGC